MRGAGLVGGRIVGSSGIFFWVWTFIALGVTAVFSLILSARGLWSLRRGGKLPVGKRAVRSPARSFSAASRKAPTKRL